jgi:large subunit ribosomal protein L3
MKGFLGKKIGMTRLADAETGKMVPVTLIEVAEQVVTKVFTSEKDGYEATQISTLPLKKEKKTRKFSFVKEFRGDVEVSEGDKYQVDAMTEGAKVRISSVSKGKGFAGRIKRHNQCRGPVSHGSHNIRSMGSTGNMKPNRTIKGFKMPGHMGVDRVTDLAVDIVKVDAEMNLVAVKGSVAGAIGNLVEMQI